MVRTPDEALTQLKLELSNQEDTVATNKVKKTTFTGQTVRLETIGPADARKILQKVHERQNGRNSETIINQYARDIAKGFWDTSVPQMIAIDRTGALLDGWHRLHAIIASDTTVQFWVMRNADPDAFKKTDSGFQRRMNFRMNMSTEATAIVHSIIRLSAYPTNPGRAATEQIELAYDFIKDTYELFLANTTRVTVRKLSQASIKTAAILNIKKHPQHTKQICAAYNALINRDFTSAPRSMNVLKTKIEDENPHAGKLFAYAYRAFTPASFNLSYFRGFEPVEIIKQVQSELLSDLSGVLF